MSTIATEATVKQELAPIIAKALNFEYTTETSIDMGNRQQTDVIYNIGDELIILELKVGSHRKLLEGIEQAEGYRASLNASGTITIVYPEEIRTRVETSRDVRKLIYDTPLEALVLVPFQRKYYNQVYLKPFVESLRTAYHKPQHTDLETLLGVLRECVQDISFLTRNKEVRSDISRSVVAQISLFSALSGPEKKLEPEALEDATADLASYIIVNQILLYFLLSRTLNLPKMSDIDSLHDLARRFELITEVDYHAVYEVDVLSHLKGNSIGPLNRIITAFRSLKPESVPYDLLGRMFHEFLPLKTRKLFATFYTKPIAAEMLADLAIDSTPSNVLEPAAGSGTILVATYRALKRKTGLDHNSVIRRLYAIDVMPFATHLAALNLTLQDLEARTESVNVGLGNSLDLHPSARFPTQTKLFGRNFRRVTAQEQLDEDLKLPPAIDLIIMNPPFTDSRRYVRGMLGTRDKAFAEMQNYWAYFLQLSNELLSVNGKIAAVLPRLFFSGSKSREVRDWIFGTMGYSLTHVVRTTREFAFSEAASFRDFLVILQRTTDSGNAPPCRVIYLNRAIDSYPLEDVQSIVKDMKLVPVGRSVVKTTDFSAFEVSQKFIKDNRGDLWPLVGFENPEDSFIIGNFLDKARRNSQNSLVSLVDFLKVKRELGRRLNLGDAIPRGFEPKPAGMYSMTFISRKRKERPDQPDTLTLSSENSHELNVEIKRQLLKIPKSHVNPAIYSASYLRSFLITAENCDYIIAKQGRFSDLLSNLGGNRIDYNYLSKGIEKCGSHILVTKRLNIVAPGTTHIAFFSPYNLVSPNSFYSINCSMQQAKVLVAWLNSIFGILQLLQLRKETEGGWCDLLKEDLALFAVPNVPSLPPKVERIFADLSIHSFDSLSEQFKAGSPREDLDRAWMEWLGWQHSEIEADISSIYSSIDNELQSIKAAAKVERSHPAQTKLVV